MSSDKNFNYRVHYLADADDANWRTYQAAAPLAVGDVIQLSLGFYHVVCAIKQQKTGVRIDVSKSSQDAEEALLVAQQDGFI